MRTTISLDDHVLEAIKRRAAQEGRSVSAYIAKILDEAVKRPRESPDPRPFRLMTAGEGGTYPEVDLDRPRELMADAQHAAVAIEHGCTFVTTDADFDRFPGLRWQHPLR